MKAIVSYLLCALISALMLEASAQMNFVPDHQVHQLFEQARFLPQQGISKDEIVKIFEQSLVRETLNSDRSDRNEKIFLIIAGTIVCLVIGGFIYLGIKEASQERAYRQELEQNIANLDQQVTQAQLRLDQTRARAQGPRPAPDAGQQEQRWNQVRAEQNAERIALDELFQLQTRATTARNELFQYDQRKYKEAKEWRERSEAWDRQRQLDRIEEALRRK